MGDWLGILFVILVLILLVRSLRRPIVRRREVRNAWRMLAGELGWVYTEGEGQVAAIITGTWQARTFELKTYVVRTRNNSPLEYVDFVAHLAPPFPQFALYARFSDIFEDGRSRWQIFRNFDRVKSGDVLFDNSYSFAGTPKEEVKRVLANAEVRAAIKAIYPLNAPIFVHPYLQLANGQLGIRIFQALETKAAIQGYLDKLNLLAEVIETALENRASSVIL